MPIRVRCPKCNETADLPDEARGKKGLCNRCGTPVQIPAEIKKVCVFCDADVTNTAHIKDPQKNYVCETCWKGRQADPPRLQDTVAPAAPESEIEPAPTSTLDPDFAAADHERSEEAVPAMDGASEPSDAADQGDRHEEEPVVTISDWPYEHRHSFGRLRPKPRRATRFSTAMSLVALAVSLATAYVVWTRHSPGAAMAGPSWEDAHRAHILVLKGQAEILIEMGHVKEGVARYEELERLVKDKPIRDPALRDALLAAWRARDTAVSKELLTQQVAADSSQGASPSTTPVQTTITLIEEPTAAARPATTQPTTQRTTFDPN